MTIRENWALPMARIEEYLQDHTQTFDVLKVPYHGNYQKKLKELPPNGQSSYGGTVESEMVVETLEKEHVFLFTTIGENYSHVIHEALSAGCPCVISDQTPWQNLAENYAGQVLALDDNYKFVQAIESYEKMTEKEFQRASEAAHEYAKRFSRESAETTGYRIMFNNIQ